MQIFARASGVRVWGQSGVEKWLKLPCPPRYSYDCRVLGSDSGLDYVFLYRRYIYYRCTITEFGKKKPFPPSVCERERWEVDGLRHESTFRPTNSIFILLTKSTQPFSKDFFVRSSKWFIVKGGVQPSHSAVFTCPDRLDTCLFVFLPGRGRRIFSSAV